jgi:hypothetical protein
MIASRSTGTYFARVIPLRLMRVMTLLAVLLAPLGMMSTHVAAAAAMAGAHAMPMAHDMEAAAMPGHCPPADGEQDQGKMGPAIDCTLMCAAMPAADSALDERIAFPAIKAAPSLQDRGRGLNPAADPPPPRLS